MLQRSVFLIGYRGTGKSTVARQLAERFACDWTDSDDVIELRANKTIAAIFADHGESCFRDLEQAVVSDLASGPPQVVALGGGAVLREANRVAIEGNPVVWLTASPAALAARLSADATSAARRPTLTGAGLLQEIEQVLAERTPIYRQCATLVVDTENRSPQAVADAIYRGLTST